MEKRAVAAGSPWRIAAILAIGVTIGRVLLGKVGKLFKLPEAGDRSGRD
jgi:hypothetical protein